MNSNSTKFRPLGSLRPQISEVHLYGGGLSGLLLAYYLQKEGYRITLFEKQGTLGGKIQTHTTASGLVETGANAILTNDDVWELIDNLDLSVVEPTPNLKRKILRHPAKEPSTFPSLLTAGEWLQFLSALLFSSPSQFPHIQDQTVQEFFLPLLGKKVCEEVLTPVLNGVYALPASELHLFSVFKGMSIVSADSKHYGQLLWELKKNFGNVEKNRPKSYFPSKKIRKMKSVSFPGGMQDLVKALARVLQEHLKGSIKLSSSPPLNPEVNHCLCTNALEAAEILQHTPQYSHLPLIGLLKKLNYLPIRTSTYFLSSSIPVLQNSYGLLFAPNSGFRNLGILHNSAIFPQRVVRSIGSKNIWSYTFISRGANDHHTDVTYDLIRLGIDVDKAIIEKRATYYSQGLPKYDSNRFHVLQEMHDKKNLPEGLLLFGNYTHGISLRDLVSGAKAMAGSFARNR